MNVSTKKIGGFAALIAVVLSFSTFYASAQNQKDLQPMVVSAGKSVSLEYSLTVDGAVLDTNTGREPLVYTHGGQQIVPGLERELAGMKTGDSKKVVVKPEDGYGVINKEAFIEVQKSQVPVEAHKVGAQLTSQDPQGRVMRPVVSELKGETIVLNFNHPLAGKTLNFDVKVVEVKDAPAPTVSTDTEKEKAKE